MSDDFGLSALREVLRLIDNTDITELKIERNGAKLHVRRGATPPAGQAPFLVTPSLAAALPQHLHSPLPPIAPFQHHAVPTASPPAPEAGPGAAPSAGAPAGEPIVAPMVGTFFNAPSPKDSPYVHEGDIIHPGDRVGIVEAMKMMNEIEAEIGGRIVKILVKNGQAVEYGQPLMLVEPL